MTTTVFSSFFQGDAETFLLDAIRTALAEDGEDLTSNAIFSSDEGLYVRIIANKSSFVAGLPILPLILKETAQLEEGSWNLRSRKQDGAFVEKGAVIAEASGSARVLFRAERVMLNFLCHLSGIASLVQQYNKELEGTGVKLLDTRKTLPGLRYPQKYAVLVGGGMNHRRNLSELFLLKSNHVEAAGGVIRAIENLVSLYPNSLVEVECKSLKQVEEAVECNIHRIMLTTIDPEFLKNSLGIIPSTIEVELSGDISLKNIREICSTVNIRKPDFVSVGRLTNSASAAEFTMNIAAKGFMAYSRV